MPSDHPVAYKGGRASRYLGIDLERNPYPYLHCSNAMFIISTEKRAEWRRGWLEQDADLALNKQP